MDAGVLTENPQPTEFVQIGRTIQAFQSLTEKERQRFGEHINDGYMYLKGKPQDHPECAFLRETERVADQSPFSEVVTQIGLVPIRGELLNGHLYNFIEGVLNQQEKIT